jgi:hypothetical protein
LPDCCTGAYTALYLRLLEGGAAVPKHAAVQKPFVVRNPVVCVCSCTWLIGRTGVVVSALFNFMLSNKCIRAKRDPGANRNRDCRASPDCCGNIGGYWAPLPCSNNKLDNEDGAVRMSWRRSTRHGTAGAGEVPVPRCDTCFWVAMAC